MAGEDFSFYKNPFDTELGSELGGFFTPPTVADTFRGSPERLWQTARLGAMGNQAAIPQFQRAAMQGFEPAFGNYLLGSAGIPTFSNYLGSGMQGQPPTLQNWQSAIGASAALDPSATLDAPIGPSGLEYQGLLQGENARRNALAMAGSAMGGGVGLGAQARQRALGNMYDLYGSRAAGQGQPTGTFLNWLSSRITPTLT